MKFDISYEIEKKDDKEYIVPKKLRFDFEVKDNASFNLTNLFNGNKELSKYLSETFPFFGLNLIMIILLKNHHKL